VPGIEIALWRAFGQASLALKPGTSAVEMPAQQAGLLEMPTQQVNSLYESISE